MPCVLEKMHDAELDTLKKDNQVVILEETNQIMELQTILKDSKLNYLRCLLDLKFYLIKEIVLCILSRTTEHSDFVFYADRLMRLVIEEALNRLPYTEMTVITPTHCHYKDRLIIYYVQ
uniref:Phosphoribosyltransferase domain-containing protein n=1 Tax=Heterorhabditis bacteriophora TaxID=37862 RepID=A0A1I7WKG6_HETBA